jgi:hypothetical protein
MNPPYKIGSYLKHKSGVLIKLERYDTQLVINRQISLSENNIKSKPNYNYLYGNEIETNKKFNGLTKDFKLVTQV